MPRARNLSRRSYPDRARGIQSLRRAAEGTKEPRRTILIVCEGKKTEPLYLNALKQQYRRSSIQVEIIERGGAPINVVDRAIAMQYGQDSGRRPRDKRSANYDEAWCVFDTELPEHPTLGQAVRKANVSNIALAVTNPAFEYWFLLHFVYTDRSFDNVNELYDNLRIYIPGYRKNESCFPQLSANTRTAIQHALRLEQKNGTIDQFPHPSTSVHRLVRLMLDM